MKILLIFILIITCFPQNNILSKTYYLRGENKYGTFYLNRQGLNDSLYFIKLFNSKGNEIEIDISKKVEYFTPNENPSLLLIKLDYSFEIPQNLNLNDSLFRLAYKTQYQYDTNYDYQFYILSEPPKSNLTLKNPQDNSNDIDLIPYFQWSEETHPAIKLYRFQLSENEDFSNLIIDTLLFNNKFTPNFELKPETKYFWRVKADFPENQIGYKVFSFKTGIITNWLPFEIEKYHYAQDIQIIDNSKIILADHQVGFLLSDDEGINWTKIKLDGIIPFKITPIYNNSLYSFCFDINDSKYKIIESNNQGLNWETKLIFDESLPYQTNKKFSHLISEKEFIISFRNKLIFYNDINSLNLQKTIQIDSSEITSFVQLNSGKIIAVTESKYVKNEIDNGDIYIIDKDNTLKKVFANYNGLNIDFISIIELENKKLIASGNLNNADTCFFFTSIDEGETWQLASQINGNRVIGVVATYDGFIYASFSNSKMPIRMSVDYGLNWINKTGNISAQNTAWDIKIINDENLYFLSNNNIIYKTNIVKPDELKVYPVNDIKINNNNILFQWQKNKRVEKYNIQISENKEFNSLDSIPVPIMKLFNKNIESYKNSYEFTGFEINKTYYWRVRGYYENKWMEWSKTFEFNVIEDITNSVTQNFQVSIFPNPARDKINISILKLEINSTISNNKLIISNSLGKVVYSNNLTNTHKNEYNLSIDISKYSNGIYYLKIGNSLSKFIIQK